MRLPVLRSILWGLVGAVSLVLIWGVVSAGRGGSPRVVAATPIGGAFELTDHTGASRTWASFRGKPVAVFFGFTNCPDICPTTLAELTQLLQGLGEKGDELSVLLVTGDPKRDTPAVLKDYISSFDPRIVALTGPEAEIDRAFSAFKAYRKIVPTDGGGYTVDHSAGVYLYGRDGGFSGTLDMHEPQEVRLAKLETLVSR